MRCKSKRFKTKRFKAKRFKTKLVLIAACACVLIPNVSAFALPPRRPARIRVASRSTVSTMARVIAVSTSMLNGSALVAEARNYLGPNPTDRKRLWCATFMNFILAKLGYAGTNSDAAKSFAYSGWHLSEPRIGVIAVLARGKAGAKRAAVPAGATGARPEHAPLSAA